VFHNDPIEADISAAVSPRTEAVAAAAEVSSSDDMKNEAGKCQLRATCNEELRL
jgi:azurin